MEGHEVCNTFNTMVWPVTIQAQAHDDSIVDTMRVVGSGWGCSQSLRCVTQKISIDKGVILYGLAKGRCSQRDATSFGTDKTGSRVGTQGNVRGSQGKTWTRQDTLYCVE